MKVTSPLRREALTSKGDGRLSRTFSAPGFWVHHVVLWLGATPQCQYVGLPTHAYSEPGTAGFRCQAAMAYYHSKAIPFADQLFKASMICRRFTMGGDATAGAGLSNITIDHAAATLNYSCCHRVMPRPVLSTLAGGQNYNMVPATVSNARVFCWQQHAV